MNKGIKFISILVGFLILTLFSTAVFSQKTTVRRNFHSGAVYVLTNQVNNSIAVFTRDQNGNLTAAGTFSTGGSGNPVAIPPDPPTDPLASQGSLILSENQLLFAVNAGSNEISVLSIGKSGLTLVDKVDSGGVRPISLTVHENLLFVLNEGGTPNITGFTIEDDGTLAPLDGSTRPLIGGAGADPAEVSFSPDGTLLVVTEKMGNRLDTYTVDDKGVPSQPIANPSSGMTPFGFAFNNDGYLFVSEAFGGMPNQGKMSSYSTSAGGMLSVVSASVPDFQTAACWVVITNNGKFAFVSNTGSGSISSYFINDDGTIELLHSVAGSTGAGSSPIDMALSNNSRFLYVTDNGTQMVHSFEVEKDGTLTSIDNDGGLPFGVQGIAAK